MVGAFTTIRQTNHASLKGILFVFILKRKNATIVCCFSGGPPIMCRPMAPTPRVSRKPRPVLVCHHRNNDVFIPCVLKTIKPRTNSSSKHSISCRQNNNMYRADLCCVRLTPGPLRTNTTLDLKLLYSTYAVRYDVSNSRFSFLIKKMHSHINGARNSLVHIAICLLSPNLRPGS